MFHVPYFLHLYVLVSYFPNLYILNLYLLIYVHTSMLPYILVRIPDIHVSYFLAHCRLAVSSKSCSSVAVVDLLTGFSEGGLTSSVCVQVRCWSSWTVTVR